MDNRLSEMKLDSFITVLGSNQPAPGGGSAAALAGASAAALLAMFCRLTIGKKKYESAHAKVTEVLEQAEKIAKNLTQAVDDDAQAYLGLASAFGLPKSTPDEAEARKKAIEKAAKRACDVPLNVATECHKLIQLLEQITPIGNISAISDAGCAVLLASAGAKGAALNVYINLKGNLHNEWAQSAKSKIKNLIKDLTEIENKLLDRIQKDLE